MKSYTDLEQSKKLAEILPIDSADMYYWRNGEHLVVGRFSKELQEGFESRGLDYTPCWSLAALLGYLNQDWYVNLIHDGICWQCVIDHHDRKERHCSSVLTDEPIDCCVELVELIVKFK